MNEYLEGEITLDGRTKLSSIKSYLVRLTVQIPYPKSFEYRTSATTIAPAVSRAIKLLRKDLKGKKIKELTLKAIQL